MRYTETFIATFVGSLAAFYLYNNVDNLRIRRKHNRRKKYASNDRKLPRSNPSNTRPFTSKR